MATPSPPKVPIPERPRPFPTIEYFAVYSPLYGQAEEAESEQVLYFYPEEWPIDDKIKKIGLAQGLVNFTR